MKPTLLFLLIAVVSFGYLVHCKRDLPRRAGIDSQHYKP